MDESRSGFSPQHGDDVRLPAFAGKFYPANPEECQTAARRYVQDATIEIDAGRKWIGGIVPHAGWICSAAIAGQTIAAIAQNNQPNVVIVFGAIHTPLPTKRALLDTHRRWQTPGDEFEIAEQVQAKLAELNDLIGVDARFHQREHAVEVELPLIKAAWPKVMLVPIETPPSEQAAALGTETAKRVMKTGLNAIYLASSDLTHYGPSYRFTPAGVGAAALNWAKDNDRRLLDLVVNMEIDRIVPEVQSRLNACGGGAIAAMLSACREQGASNGTLLNHANSFETLAAVHPQPPTDAVGYAAVVVG